MKKNELSREDFKKYLNEHVLYELSHAFQLPSIDTDNHFLLNDVCFAKFIHLRVLREFFEKKEKEKEYRNDGFYAQDYGFIQREIVDDRVKLNQHKLHLGLDRFNNPNYKKWDDTLFKEIRLIAIEFIDHLKSNEWIVDEKMIEWNNLHLTLLSFQN